MVADNINFGKDSLYVDFEQKVKTRSATHERESIKLEPFAKQVVSQVLTTTPTSYIWKGTNALLVWLPNAIGPRKVFDSTMKKGGGHFGWKGLCKSLRDYEAEVVQSIGSVGYT